MTVDAPDFQHFMGMAKSDVVTNPSLSYMRLHAHDETAFTKGKSVSERFNYEYSRCLAEDADDVHIIYNNNHSNLAPKAAEQFVEMIK